LRQIASEAMAAAEVIRGIDVQSGPTRVLIVGAKGLLGTPTLAAFQRDAGVDVQGADLPELDITDERSVGRLFGEFTSDLVVNCAAYTQVDGCEQNEALACKVNGTGAGILAKAAAACRARMIHISTDYVFEGDASRPYPEDHPTGRPEKLSAYGRSKLLGEQLVRQHHPGALIVRTAWLYGPNGLGFPNAILRRAREDGRLRVVNDQTGSPTYAPDLAEALHKLGRLDVGGFMHVTNSGQCTWYQFACEIVRIAGLDVPVQPVTTAEFPRPAKRPTFSVLDNRRYVEVVGASLRPWQGAIREFMDREQ
jgi:dTDP-4-dehydrorhamnose reductase